MRFATGVDDDLRPFHDRFRDDPVIGRVGARRPRLRVRRQPDPWETLLGAITEQLIELERAIGDPAAPDRARSATAARTPACATCPTAATIAAMAPARLVVLRPRAQARDRPAPRAPTRSPAAASTCGDHDRAAAAGDPRDRPVDGRDARPARPGAAGRGPGRRPRVPEDRRAAVTGNPRARADEAEVRGFFERYGEWKGLAGVHLMHAAARGLIPARWSPRPPPRPAGTRWSAAPARPARAA